MTSAATDGLARLARLREAVISRRQVIIGVIGLNALAGLAQARRLS